MKFLSYRKQDGSLQPYPGHPETLCIEIWKPCSLRPGEERAQLSRRLRSSLAVASVLDMMLPDNVVPRREIPELPQMNAESTFINQPNQAEIPTPPVRHQRDLAVRPQSRQEQLRNANPLASRVCRECARTISLTCPRGKKGSEWLGKNISHDEACNSTELLRNKHEETIEIAQYIFMYCLMFGITSIVQSLPCIVST